MQFVTLLWTVLLCLSTAHANVEKVVFLGPPPLSQTVHSIAELHYPYLEAISPLNTSLRRVLQSKVESPAFDGISEAWVLLDGLEEGRRYEVRVCWSATQPTAFDLDVHSLQSVLESPELLAGLESYISKQSISRGGEKVEKSELWSGKAIGSTQSSSLLFRIAAQADYYTTRKRLMSEGLPVKIEIILDPFILNIFPRSLGTTALYILAVAVLSWYLSAHVYQFLSSIASSSPQRDRRRKAR